MPTVSDLRVKIFADGADLAVIARMAANPLIKGFTTNPTLMRKAGVTDYVGFAHDLLRIVPDRPISFEVFSDDFDEMAAQALEISSWAPNVFVKIPITNTRGAFSDVLIAALASQGVQVNVTAVLTTAQVERVIAALSPDVASYVSVFAGRIADTGLDPLPIMQRALDLMRPLPKTELIWASPRELLNVIQADSIGCHVITATSDVLAKLPLIGKDLDEFSLDTVQMFRNDAVSAGFSIPISSGISVQPA
jgi:transaldolase